MPKVTYTSAKGLIQEAGSGVSFETLPFSPLKTQNVSSGSVALPGVYTVSGGYGVNAGNSYLETVMPVASRVPGGFFTFRSLSADAHILTGSAEVEGTKVFAGAPAQVAGAQITSTSAQGSQLRLPAVLGSSVTLMSDGVNFLVVASSGSYTISGT